MHFWDGPSCWTSAGCRCGGTFQKQLSLKQKQCLIRKFKSKYKRFFLSASNACWTVQRSVRLPLLVSGFSPSGRILWSLVWVAAEKCHSRGRSELGWCRRVSAAPHFIKRVQSWNSKAWEQRGISDVFQAVLPLGLCLVLHPTGTPFESRGSSCVTSDLQTENIHMIQSYISRCLQMRWIIDFNRSSISKKLTSKYLQIWSHAVCLWLWNEFKHFRGCLRCQLGVLKSNVETRQIWDTMDQQLNSPRLSLASVIRWSWITYALYVSIFYLWNRKQPFPFS